MGWLTDQPYLFAIGLTMFVCLSALRKETTMTEPTPTEMIRELQQHLGLSDHARPVSPKQVWEEALAEVDAMRLDHCRPDQSCRHVWMTE